MTLSTPPDPTAAGPRTRLAWARTGAALVVVVLAVIRLALVGAPVAAVAVLALATLGTAAVLGAGAVLTRRRDAG